MSQDQNTAETEGQTPEDENRLIAERRGKLNSLRKLGEAYPNGFRVNTTAGALQKRFADDDAEALEGVDETFAVAGRMMAKRVMGKLAFVRLQDRDGDIQLMVQRDQLPEGVFLAYDGLRLTL